MQRVALVFDDRGHLPAGPAGRHEGAAAVAPLGPDPHRPAVAVAQAVAARTEDRQRTRAQAVRAPWEATVKYRK